MRIYLSTFFLANIKEVNKIFDYEKKWSRCLLEIANFWLIYEVRNSQQVEMNSETKN